MAGPNLELFKFSLYLFFPLAIMIHYGDPQWYHDNVLPVRDRFWPDESTLYKPPRNAADVKSELAELRALRLTNKERKEKGLPPLAPTPRPAASTSSSQIFPDQSNASHPGANERHFSPSLRDGASIGSIWKREATPIRPSPSQREPTWRETWDDATTRHVV